MYLIDLYLQNMQLRHSNNFLTQIFWEITLIKRNFSNALLHIQLYNNEV